MLLKNMFVWKLSNVKCEVGCHKKRDNNNIKYSNLDISYLRLQKDLQVWGKDDKRNEVQDNGEE